MGDNPIKKKKSYTRRQPWKKQLTGDNQVKNRQIKRKCWTKTMDREKTL
jgi:hypothetical protein